MRATWTISVCLSMSFAGAAAAETVIPADKLRNMRPRLDDLRITPVVPPAPNCGDVVPFTINPGGAPPPPGALPGSGSTYYFTPGTMHIQAVAVVRNVGTQPSGGTEANQFVTVMQRIGGVAGETQRLRARFRPLAAGAEQRFQFTIQMPFDTTTYRPLTAGAVTLTASLSFNKFAPVTLRPADCNLSNNVLVRELRFW